MKYNGIRGGKHIKKYEPRFNFSSTRTEKVWGAYYPHSGDIDINIKKIMNNIGDNDFLQTVISETISHEYLHHVLFIEISTEASEQLDYVADKEVRILGSGI